MSDINSVTLAGRLVRDPQVNTNPTGTGMAQFMVASNRQFKSRDNNLKRETAFVSCKAFGAWAANLRGRQKGDLVIATGHLKTESWEADGTMCNQLILVCQSVHVVTLAPKVSMAAPLTGVSPVENSDSVPF